MGVDCGKIDNITEITANDLPQLNLMKNSPNQHFRQLGVFQNNH